MTTQFSLQQLGWRPALQQLLSFDDIEQGYPARVDSVHRDRIHAMSEQGPKTVLVSGILNTDQTERRPTTGDWLLLSYDDDRPLKLLDRLNVLKRTAAGTDPKSQIMASNLDTLFIVTSCNQDFNVSRLERYLSLVMAAHIPAVIVLTKADLAEDTDNYRDIAAGIHRDVPVIVVNALGHDVQAAFAPWTRSGQTIAFIGSSGVGKSTLTNALLGDVTQDTGGIREDDAKGRHTTTDRSMHPMETGAWVMDTPGMRELRLNDDLEGIAEVFDDIKALMQSCRFSNCHHQGDQGCAIEDAIASGQLEARRWQNYQKLHEEAELAALTKRERQKRRTQWGKDIAKLTRQHKKLK